MKMFNRIFSISLTVACVSFAFATNGMNMIGFGARMSAMGGASLGMTNSAHLLNTNPAAITSITGHQMDYGMALMFPALTFKNNGNFTTWSAREDTVRAIDQFYYEAGVGMIFDTTYSAVFQSDTQRRTLNNVDSQFGVFPLPQFGYVNSPVSSRWSYGMGFYAQGGMGATYENVSHETFRDFSDMTAPHDIWMYQEANEFHHYSPAEGVFYNSYDSLGTTIYTDSLYITDIPTITGYPFLDLKYHSKLAYMKFVQALAYELSDDISVGIAFDFGFSMMEMAMPYSISPDLMVGKTEPMVPDPTGQEQEHNFGELFSNPPEKMGLGYEEVTAYATLADNMADAATATSVGVRFGVQYKINDRLTIGSTYTPQVSMEFTGKAIMDMTVQFQKAFLEMVDMMYNTGHNAVKETDYTIEDAIADVTMQLSDVRGIDLEGADAMVANFDAVIDFGWPRQFGFGMAYEKSDKLTLAADFQWYDWSETMENFVMHFNNGDNYNINLMMGTPDGNMVMVMPMNWKDQFVIAMGAEYKYSDDLDLRFGFNYGNNPVPENTVIPVFPAIVENHFTFGLGYRLNDDLRLDVAYELVPKATLNSTDNNIVANEYNGSSSSLSENTIYFSLSRTF